MTNQTLRGITPIDFVVEKTNDGSQWKCCFTLNGQEHVFTNEDPTKATLAAIDFLKTQGTINNLTLVRE